MPTYAIINGSVVQPLFTRLWLSPSCCLPYCKPSSPSHFLFPHATAAILIVGATPCNGSCYCYNRVTNSARCHISCFRWKCWCRVRGDLSAGELSSGWVLLSPCQTEARGNRGKGNSNTYTIHWQETPRCTILCKSLKSFHFMWTWSLLKIFFGHELLFHSFRSLLIAFCGFAFYIFVNWCLK